MKRREFIAGLGGTVAWPVTVPAQQQTKPIIGVLDLQPEGPQREGLDAAFRRGFAEVGFLESDITIDYRNADGHPERLPALAADLVRQRPAAIIANSGISALAAKAATRDIPIIFAAATDPVESGLVTSLNRPGGNLTGVAALRAEIAEKRLELLHKAVPAVETIALLVGPADAAFNQTETGHTQSAARTLGLRLLVFNVTTDSEIASAFATLVEHQAGAVLVGGGLILAAKRDQFLSHAARFALPTMFARSSDAQAGALLSFGPNLIETVRQMGAYTGRILKGEKPADLPVQLPTKFDLVINLKTAKALGLTIPPNLLALADEVIE
jgi:putative tryptophan/tyrosine transport system substrate-binding protein